MLVENNARQGFVEPATFLEIAKRLSAPLDDVARFGYLTGSRKNEVLTLAWSNVDRARGLITIAREHSKNAEPRIIPLTAARRLTLAACGDAHCQSRGNGSSENFESSASSHCHSHSPAYRQSHGTILCRERPTADDPAGTSICKTFWEKLR